jgi:hypothetical protein
MSDKIAIITVVYNNYSVLSDFFDGLKKQENINFHVFITDNSTVKKKLPPSDFPLTVINSENLGYAHGVNQALEKAAEIGLEKFCVINNDTYFERDFVDKILKSLDKHPTSIIGGKIYYAPGYEFHKSRYKRGDLGRIIWFAGGEIDWDNAQARHLGVDRVDHGQFEKLRPVDFITGCLMVFDKSALENVGFWDEKYFLYYEDADWSVRAVKQGIKLVYDPSIIIWHKNAQSTEGSGSLLHQKYQNKNRLRFGLKYAPLKTKLYLLKNYFLDFFR